MDKNKKQTSNLVDRFVGYFNPEAGLKRKRARIASDMVERAYEGAAKGRRTDSWLVNTADANTEIASTDGLIVQRSRDLIRNNPFARRAIDVIVSNTISHGIQGEFKDLKGKKDENLNLLWKQWAESPRCDYVGVHNIYGLQALAMRTVVESGEVIVRKMRVKPTDLDPLPMKLMVLEPDYIDSKKEGKGIVQGIEYDSTGRKLAYWLFDKHPGDAKAGQQTSKRVPVGEVVHVLRVDRPGQSRGLPWVAPVVIALRELDEYMDATIVKQKVAAAFAAFVRDIEMPSDLKKSPPLSEKIEPGAIEILPSGKDVVFPSPPSVSDFDPFVKSIIRMISVGFGVTYEALAGDYSMVNFSSARMGWLEFHRNVEAWRWLMFIPQFNDGISGWFLEAASLIGYARDPLNFVAVWTPPRREMIDPTSETAAAINAIRGGIKSYPEAIRELGDDPERKLEEIKQFNDLLDKLGIILDSDPRRTMKAGVIQTGFDASKIGQMEAAGSSSSSGSE